MARIKKDGTLVGTVGNYVYRGYKGNQVIQSKSVNKRVHKNSMDNFNEFKMASSLGKIMRFKLQFHLGERHDSNLFRRFTAALYKGIQNNVELPKGERNLFNSTMAHLKGFEFNVNKPFANTFYGKIETEHTEDHKLKVTVHPFTPNIHLKFPNHIGNAYLKFSLFTDDCQNLSPENVISHKIEFTNRHTEIDKHTFEFDLPQNNAFTIVFAELVFYTVSQEKENIIYNTKEYSPSTIIFGK